MRAILLTAIFLAACGEAASSSSGSAHSSSGGEEATSPREEGPAMGEPRPDVPGLDPARGERGADVSVDGPVGGGECGCCDDGVAPRNAEEDRMRAARMAECRRRGGGCGPICTSPAESSRDDDAPEVRGVHDADPAAATIGESLNCRCCNRHGGRAPRSPEEDIARSARIQECRAGGGRCDSGCPRPAGRAPRRD